MSRLKRMAEAAAGDPAGVEGMELVEVLDRLGWCVPLVRPGEPAEGRDAATAGEEGGGVEYDE